jgi:hypothetical protein
MSATGSIKRHRTVSTHTHVHTSRAAIDLDPQCADPHRELASLLWEGSEGRRAEIRSLFERAMALDPSDPHTLAQFAIFMQVCCRVLIGCRR